MDLVQSHETLCLELHSYSGLNQGKVRRIQCSPQLYRVFFYVPIFLRPINAYIAERKPTFGLRHSNDTHNFLKFLKFLKFEAIVYKLLSDSISL